MIEVEIPKDITKYESKLFGPFSARETVGAAIALVCGISVYTILKHLGVEGNIRAVITMIAAVPGWAIGWKKVYGQPFEKFVVSCFKLNILAPVNRKYKSISTLENKYHNIEKNELRSNKKENKKENNRLKRQKKKPKKKKNKNPDLVGYL